MKTTKKLIIALSVAAIVAPTLESCKKGENDPAISLRSRKARVAGEWTVSKMESKSINTSTSVETTTSPNGATTVNNNSFSYDVRVSFDGTNLKHVEKYSNTTNNVTTTNDTSYTGTGEIKYTFQKDGTFTRTSTRKYTRTNVTTPFPGTTQTVTWTQERTETTTGTWNFTAGIGKDNKNKDGLVITYVSSEEKVTTTNKVDYTVNNTTTTTNTVTNSTTKTTYDTNEIHENWYLDRLANKEIIAKISGKVTSTRVTNSTTTSPGGTSTYKEDLTGTSDYSTDITLVQ
jgi:hypothetical protein